MEQWSTSLVSCCYHQLLLDVWCLLGWKMSIVSSNFETTVIKLNLLLLCLQAFPRLAVLICNCCVVVGTQQTIQMHATNHCSAPARLLGDWSPDFTMPVFLRSRLV